MNYRAVISYDGTDFHGVAEQLNGPDAGPIRTVIGELRPIIAMVAQGEPKINVSGRTDKGVHAREQVITFSFPEGAGEFDPSRLAHVANKKLNPEIVIHSIEPCQEDFHARFSAKARTYRYFINNSELPDFRNARYCWTVSEKLDVEAMKLAAKAFIGEQDFTSVCKKDESMPHNIREVYKAEWVILNESEGTQILLSAQNDMNNIICFEISANAFCWNMVRSIVGVLVDVGRGKIAAEDVGELLARKSRDSNRTFAPANGLVLWSVKY